MGYATHSYSPIPQTHHPPSAHRQAPKVRGAHHRPRRHRVRPRSVRVRQLPQQRNAVAGGGENKRLVGRGDGDGADGALVANRVKHVDRPEALRDGAGVGGSVIAPKHRWRRARAAANEAAVADKAKAPADATRPRDERPRGQLRARVRQGARVGVHSQLAIREGLDHRPRADQHAANRNGARGLPVGADVSVRYRHAAARACDERTRRAVRTADRVEIGELAAVPACRQLAKRRPSTAAGPAAVAPA